MQIIKYSFQRHGDDRGQLVAMEEGKDIPFSIRRVYYIFDTAAGIARGFHAHKTLEQILICIRGSCRITLDDGRERQTVLMDEPNEGLYIGPGTWREMSDFSPDAVLVVLASQLYDERDYIRDYDEFLKCMGVTEP